MASLKVAGPWLTWRAPIPLVMCALCAAALLWYLVAEPLSGPLATALPARARSLRRSTGSWTPPTDCAVPRQAFRASFRSGITPVWADDAMVGDKVVVETVGSIDYGAPSGNGVRASGSREWRAALAARQFGAGPHAGGTGAAAGPQLPPETVGVDEFSGLWEGDWMLTPGDAVPGFMGVCPSSGDALGADEAAARAAAGASPHYYRFALTASHPARLFVDDVLVLDAMGASTATGHRVHTRVPLAAGVPHRIRCEFLKSSSMPGRRTLRDNLAPLGREHPAVPTFDGASSDYNVSSDFDDAELAGDSALAEAVTAAILRPPILRVTWEPDPTGLRIFVYQLPAPMNLDLLASEPRCRDHMFAAEVYIHEQLLRSPERTFDPDLADYFYVPVYMMCTYQLRAGAGADPSEGRALAKSAVRYVAERHPFWGRSSGGDHVFSVTYDYGVCFDYRFAKAARRGAAPFLHNSVVLSTLGDSTSPCFHEGKDIAIPPWIPHPLSRASAEHISLLSMHADRPDRGVFSSAKRDIFAYFRGQFNWKSGIGNRNDEYSRGVRAALEEHLVGDPLFDVREGTSATYVDDLRRSLFCLCPRGFAVWSPRIFEAVLAGCIPVVIADEIRLPFDVPGAISVGPDADAAGCALEPPLDWPSFSIKVSEADVIAGRLRNILLAVTEEQLLVKREAMAAIWPSMVYPVPRVPGDALSRVFGILRERVTCGGKSGRGRTTWV